MTSKRSRIIWTAGVPLSDAWLHFASRDDRTEFERLPGFVDTLQNLAARVEKSVESLPIGYSIFELARAHTDKSAVEKQLKETLLEDLFNGQLLATAYREFPSTSPSPVLIEEDEFKDADADWINSKIYVHGKIYGRVRITDQNKLADANLSKKRKGREGSGEAIRDAIEHLIKSNCDFCAQHRSESCKQIRSELGQQLEYGNGLSDVNLSKFIVGRCGIKAIRKTD